MAGNIFALMEVIILMRKEDVHIQFLFMVQKRQEKAFVKKSLKSYG